MKKLFVCLFFSVLLFSCTDNIKTRHFGGTETVKLEPNEVFVNITWKESDLWVVTKDTVTNTHYAREKSNYGVWEGKIVITK